MHSLHIFFKMIRSTRKLKHKSKATKKKSSQLTTETSHSKFQKGIRCLIKMLVSLYISSETAIHCLEALKKSHFLLLALKFDVDRVNCSPFLTAD